MPAAIALASLQGVAPCSPSLRGRVWACQVKGRESPDPIYSGLVNGVIRTAGGTQGMPFVSYTGYSAIFQSAGAVITLVKQQGAVAVEAIDFKRWDTAESSNRIDDNPDSGGATPGGGKRVFPDLENAVDPWGWYWKTAAIKVTLTPPRAGITPVIWTYDVDDPSWNQAPVDDESQPHDNASPIVGDPRRMELVPWAPSDGNGVVWARLPLSMQPGDNYRVVVSMTAAEQAGFYAPHPDPEHKGRVFDGAGQEVNNQTYPEVRVSDLLTVWRELHVEVDSMGDVAGQTAAQGGADPNDDFLDNGEDVPPPDTDGLDGAMSEAYVAVFFDEGDHNDRVPFDLNVEMNELQRSMDWDSRVHNRDDYWVTYVLAAFQGPAALDLDPDQELQGLQGLTDNPGGGSVIFLEAIKDATRKWNRFFPGNPIDPAVAESDMVVHEVGHAVAGVGNHPVTGLNAQAMGLQIGQSSPPPDSVFVNHLDANRYLSTYVSLIRTAPRPMPRG